MHNMIMTIASFILLTTLLLLANSVIRQNKDIEYDSEFVITSIGLAQSVIDEAKSKAFDENTISSSVSAASSLTASPGRESGENISLPDTSASGMYRSAFTFDDVDDYNGYRRTVNTPRAEKYSVSVAVCYVNETAPETNSGVNTFCKKMVVTVTSPYMTTPVVMNYLFSYH